MSPHARDVAEQALICAAATFGLIFAAVASFMDSGWDAALAGAAVGCIFGAMLIAAFREIGPHDPGGSGGRLT